MDIRVVALRIKGILIVILWASEGRVAECIITVRLPQVAILVRDPRYVPCRVVEVEVAFPGEAVFRQPGDAVGVCRIHRAVFVELHQYLRILGVDIRDVLDQLIILFLPGGLDHSDQVGLGPADLLRYREQDAALVLAVMLLGVGRVTVARIVGAFALAVFLVVAVPIIPGVSVSTPIITGVSIAVVSCITTPLSVAAVAGIPVVTGITIPVIPGVSVTVSIVAVIPGAAVAIPIVPASGIVFVIPVSVAGVVLPVFVGVEVV